MTPFVTLVLAGFLARFGYQMARSPVLPRFAQDLGAAPELLGLIFAASTITGVVIKLPAGALSDVLGRKRMMLLGCLFFAAPRSFTPSSIRRARSSRCASSTASPPPSSRRWLRPSWRASPREDADRSSGGSRRRMTSEVPWGL